MTRKTGNPATVARTPRRITPAPRQVATNASQVIRDACAEDAGGVARLCTQLGYPATAETISARLTELTRDGQRAAFIAVHDDAVAGFAEVRIAGSVTSGVQAELIALIVDDRHRRRGIGTTLVNAARDWAARKNRAGLRVRANVMRNEAAEFYLNAGFTFTKQQRVFDLDVARLRPPNEPRIAGE